MSEPEVPMWQRWAQFRFSVIGELLSCPPQKGQLQKAIARLSRKIYQHPIDANRRIRTGSIVEVVSSMFFIIFFAQPMSTTVFVFSVILFSIFGLAIFSLGFSLDYKLTSTTAFIAAVSLPSKAPAADTKIKLTPSALN